MRDTHLTNAQKRTAVTLLWRRVGAAVWLVFVWITLMWLLWCFPVSRSVGGGVRTSYGALQWQTIKGGEQAGSAKLLPLGTVGRSRGRPVAAVFTLLISVAGTAFIVVYGNRTFRNLTPRWQCQNCGHTVSAGYPQSNVCSECGELPNLWQDPWAFWR
ncbi:MAG: hypothetical protein ACYTFF_13400 [Planctomycetota bacterium]|jgi:hypothetical protein